MKPLLIVSAHDAGGAEIISSWLRRYWKDLRDRTELWISGPAIEIFRQKLRPSPEPGWTFPLHPPSGTERLVLCGSGFGVSELMAVAWGRKAGIRTVVWLDHWKNYRLRFSPHGAMPDEVWVTDALAKDVYFRDVWTFSREHPQVLVKGNPYADDVVRDVRRIEASQTNHSRGVLYVTEPGRIGLFSRWLQLVAGIEQAPVRVRIHPAEDLAAYEPLRDLRETLSLEFTQDPEVSLPEDLAWAQTVVGADTMALHLAAQTGRRAVSILPNNERLTLPPEGIERRPMNEHA